MPCAAGRWIAVVLSLPTLFSCGPPSTLEGDIPPGKYVVAVGIYPAVCDTDTGEVAHVNVDLPPGVSHDIHLIQEGVAHEESDAAETFLGLWETRGRYTDHSFPNEEILHLNTTSIGGRRFVVGFVPFPEDSNWFNEVVPAIIDPEKERVTRSEFRYAGRRILSPLIAIDQNRFGLVYLVKNDTVSLDIFTVVEDADSLRLEQRKAWACEELSLDVLGTRHVETAIWDGNVVIITGATYSSLPQPRVFIVDEDGDLRRIELSADHIPRRLSPYDNYLVIENTEKDEAILARVDLGEDDVVEIWSHLEAPHYADWLLEDGLVAFVGYAWMGRTEVALRSVNEPLKVGFVRFDKSLGLPKSVHLVDKKSAPESVRMWLAELFGQE